MLIILDGQVSISPQPLTNWAAYLAEILTFIFLMGKLGLKSLP